MVYMIYMNDLIYSKIQYAKNVLVDPTPPDPCPRACGGPALLRIAVLCKWDAIKVASQHVDLTIDLAEVIVDTTHRLLSSPRVELRLL